jgi:hypothetical protein
LRRLRAFNLPRLLEFASERNGSVPPADPAWKAYLVPPDTPSRL